MTDDRLALLVLGMHRSGTSALTRIAGHLDLALPGNGIGAHPDNPRGYFEPQAVVRVDDRILRTAHTSWFDPRPLDLTAIPADVAARHRADLRAAVAESFGDARRIVVKDPRICRLVPLVRDALTEAGFAIAAVLMVRPAAEVARSLAARDRSTPDYAHALWLRHMIDAERDTRDMPRAVLTYGGLLDDWRGAMAKLAVVAGRPGWTADENVAVQIGRFLDRGLRRHHRVSSELDARLAPIVAGVEAAMNALAEREDSDARARVAAAAKRWDASRHLLDDIVHEELRHRRHAALEAESAPDPVFAEPVEAPAPSASPEARSSTSLGTNGGSVESSAVRTSLAEQIALVRGSGLFDEAWYRERYPDAAGRDPVEHYLTVGAPLGHDPHPLFRTGYYARQMARGAAS